MQALKHYMETWRRYRDFRGRSTRSAYWWTALVHAVVYVVLQGIFAAIFDITSGQAGPEIIYGIAYIVPSLALAVRRLHDVGRSGHWLWISLTGFGILALLYWFVQPSSAQTNDLEDSPTQGGIATASSDTEPEPPQQTSDIIR